MLPLLVSLFASSDVVTRAMCYGSLSYVDAMLRCVCGFWSFFVLRLIAFGFVCLLACVCIMWFCVHHMWVI